MAKKKDQEPQDLVLLTRPYTFVLQEGGAIRQNYMDYSLKLLTGRPEMLISKKRISNQSK